MSESIPCVTCGRGPVFLLEDEMLHCSCCGSDFETSDPRVTAPEQSGRPVFELVLDPQLMNDQIPF